jgi:hypothetical protein
MPALHSIKKLWYWVAFACAIFLIGMPYFLAEPEIDYSENVVNKRVQNLVDNKRFMPQQVSNFSLLDHRGKAHELFYYDDAKAIVIMVQGNGCPIVRNSIADYEALAEKYRLANIRFFYLNSNLQDTRLAIAEEATDWGITYPVLHDDAQIVGRDLKLARTGEVLLIDPAKRAIVYRGPLHDRVAYEVQKAAITNYYLENAIEQLLAGEQPNKADQHVKGCLVNFPDIGDISYSEDVVPILKKHCIECHQDGGIAPWAMSSYEMVQGFAPMIKEVVTTARMPPWDGDPAVGNWIEKGLSKSDKQKLIKWIDDGAKNLSGRDPLGKLTAHVEDWPFGEPDLIVDIPAFDIPATGIIEYRYAQIRNEHPDSVWLKAVAIKPGDPKALHHLNAGLSDSGLQISKAVSDDYLIVWSPGTNLGRMPAGTGVELKPNQNFLFEMHYTTYGRIGIDRSKLGLYFAEQAPKKIMRFAEVANILLNIPPFKRAHEEHAYITFDHDATLYMLGPHAHYRGKSFTYTFRYPDGSEELALSVPTYDFNWQRGYHFTEPKKVPKGTKLIVKAVYDNSKFNYANPDPSKRVFWGDQSEDEMLLGAVTFSWDAETPNQIIHDSRKWTINRRFGYLDTDIDGYITATDLPSDRRKLFPQFLKAVDKNNDSMITLGEWYARPEVHFY